MSRNVKLILIIGGSFLLLTMIVVGVGIYLIAQKSKGWAESSMTVMRDGEEFGKQTDEQGCLSKALTRMKKTPGLTDGFKSAIDNNLFLTGCLDTSRPTPEFCAGVPPVTEIMASVAWRAESCRKEVKQDPYGYCNNLFSAVQTHCKDRRKTPARER